MAREEKAPARFRIGCVNSCIAVLSCNPIVHKDAKRYCRVIFDLHFHSQSGTIQLLDFEKHRFFEEPQRQLRFFLYGLLDGLAPPGWWLIEKPSHRKRRALIPEFLSKKSKNRYS
jgi:hypothetical protein